MSNDINDIPELPLPELLDSSTEEELADESGGCRTYAFIGSGQCGGRIVESLYRLGYRKVLVCNTAPQDLKGISDIPDDQKIQLDAGVEGAGKDMRAGQSAAEKGQHRIYEAMMSKFGKVDHIFICFGSGGGSGSGSSLVLLETAKKYMSYIGEDSKGKPIENPDLKVGFIVTVPTNGECASPGVAQNAKYLLDVLSDYSKKRLCSPLIIVDNDKIKKLYPQATVKDSTKLVNDTVAGLFHTFNLFPKKDTNYTVFDSADYGSIMESGGCMILGVTTIKEQPIKAEGIAHALRVNLERTLLADGFDLRTATHVGVVVLGGSTIFEQVPGLMKSIEEGFDAIAVLTGDALVHRGIYENNKDMVSVYTLVGGLDAPHKRIAQIARFQSVNPGDISTKSNMPPPRFGKSKIYDE